MKTLQMFLNELHDWRCGFLKNYILILLISSYPALRYQDYANIRSFSKSSNRRAFRSCVAKHESMCLPVTIRFPAIANSHRHKNVLNIHKMITE